ncbi:hypothetical protein O181_023233 [Austropuccinia psidii MF-1]|uniref:Uncharacterized protein n=1 Tax=Austropuccinia psidii MF-1 TaxID=1389203 RepID=A0A9Q3GX40_9BASI|nr:hypothetical protein [Austropuccinia psidii MF-1]
MLSFSTYLLVRARSETEAKDSCLLASKNQQAAFSAQFFYINLTLFFRRCPRSYLLTQLLLALIANAAVAAQPSDKRPLNPTPSWNSLSAVDPKTHSNHAETHTSRNGGLTPAGVAAVILGMLLLLVGCCFVVLLFSVRKRRQENAKILWLDHSKPCTRAEIADDLPPPFEEYTVVSNPDRKTLEVDEKKLSLPIEVTQSDEAVDDGTEAVCISKTTKLASRPGTMSSSTPTANSFADINNSRFTGSHMTRSSKAPSSHFSTFSTKFLQWHRSLTFSSQCGTPQYVVSDDPPLDGSEKNPAQQAAVPSSPKPAWLPKPRALSVISFSHLPTRFSCFFSKTGDGSIPPLPELPSGMGKIGISKVPTI